MWVKAENYASALGARCAFQLEIEGVNSIFAFKIDGRDDEEDPSDKPAELPGENEEFRNVSAKLITALSLEHTREGIGLLLELVKEMLTHNKAIVAEQGRTIRSLTDERASTWNMFQEMADKKLERDLILRRELKKDEMKEGAMKMIAPLAQSMAMQVMAHKAQAEGADPLAGLRETFRDFTPAQLQKLAESGILTPEQLSGLMALFGQMASEPVAEAAE